MPEPREPGQSQEENVQQGPEITVEEKEELEKELDRQRINKELFGDVDVDKITTDLLRPGDAPNRREEFDLIEVELDRRFPNTYKRTTKEIDEIAKSELGIKVGDFFHNKHRSVALYEMAAFVKGDSIDEKDAMDEIERELKDKKILILGDDTGSLSEVLNSLGAKAIGIEVNKNKVDTAHSGILSEDGKPQDQVILGDIGDLADNTSELYKKMVASGPFDIIYSWAVFNGGSGIEKAIYNFNIRNKIRGDAVIDFSWELVNNLNSLLNESGFMLHDRVDMWEVFGPYGMRQSKKFGRGTFSKSGYGIGSGVLSDVVFIPKSISEKVFQRADFEDNWLGLKV